MGIDVGPGVDVGLDVDVGLGVGVSDGVNVGVLLGAGVGVLVGIGAGVLVGVGTGVSVGMGVGVSVGVCVGVGALVGGINLDSNVRVGRCVGNDLIGRVTNTIRMGLYVLWPKKNADREQNEQIRQAMKKKMDSISGLIVGSLRFIPALYHS